MAPTTHIHSSARRLLVALAFAAGTGAAAGATAAEPAPQVPPAEVGDGAVVARVGTDLILAGDFRREMLRRGGGVPGRYGTTEQRMALLDEMIRGRAVVQAARQAGYDRDPEFVATVEKILATRYLEDHLGAGRERVEIGDDEVEAYYRAHAEEFRIPARVRGAWIFIEVPRKATPEKVEEARQRAESVRLEALALPTDAKGFGALAQKSSDDSGTRYIGGEFGWVTASEAEGFRYGREVADAVLALSEPGAISPVVRTAQGFAIVRLVVREEAGAAPVEKMAPGIRNRMAKERRSAVSDSFYSALLKDLPVTRDEAAVAAIAPLAPPAATKSSPPSLPGSR